MSRALVAALVVLALHAPHAHADPVADVTQRIASGESNARALTLRTPGAPAAPGTRTKPPLEVSLQGGTSFSVPFLSWNTPTAYGSRNGTLNFDALRVGARARYGPIHLDVEYRIYARYQFIRRAFVGYDIGEHASVDIGVSRAPFGLLPFASNSWFFGLPYYVGLEDDADFGLRGHWSNERFDVWVAFYRNSEGHFVGRSADSARFSYDAVLAPATELVGTGIVEDRNDRELDEGVARFAYTLTRPKARLELGASGRLGTLQNTVTRARSPHFATAAHLRGTFGPFGLDLEGVVYGYHPNVSATDDRRLVVLGAFDAPYAVAARGYLLVANVSLSFDVAWGPIEKVRAYFDTGSLWKRDGGFPSSHQLVAGLYALAGPVHLSIDLAFGKNHPWIGANYASAFAAGDGSDRWYRWLNINTGFSY